MPSVAVGPTIQEGFSMLHSAIERARRQNIVEQRKAARHVVHIRSVMIDVELNAEPITILNLSTNGLMASTPGKFQIGAICNIEIPELGQVAAIIRWSGNGVVGCEFSDLIDDESFFSYLGGVATAG
jgi:hypothetical protein